ncbi:hypothetical protein QFZ87_002589 [Bacillus sp. SLBN-46]|nr:hypothetical protein [Bacillus sp. SLBN-46]
MLGILKTMDKFDNFVLWDSYKLAIQIAGWFFGW